MLAKLPVHRLLVDAHPSRRQQCERQHGDTCSDEQDNATPETGAGFVRNQQNTSRITWKDIQSFLTALIYFQFRMILSTSIKSFDSSTNAT